VIPEFIGKIKQTPPAFSAIKINGQRAYDLARKGEEFEIKQREIEIYSLKLLNIKLMIINMLQRQPLRRNALKEPT
jgi:tRNA pseudouridine55 synthase